MSENYIEHIGIVVSDSKSMAEWYAEHLDFEILNSFATDDGHVAFIRCAHGNLIFELISNANMEKIASALTHPLQFHIAIASTDISADKQRLLDAGGTFVMNCQTGDPGAQVLIIADPWGNNVQLAQRKQDFYMR